MPSNQEKRYIIKELERVRGIIKQIQNAIPNSAGEFKTLRGEISRLIKQFRSKPETTEKEFNGTWDNYAQEELELFRKRITQTLAIIEKHGKLPVVKGNGEKSQ